MLTGGKLCGTGALTQEVGGGKPVPSLPSPPWGLETAHLVTVTVVKAEAASSVSDTNPGLSALLGCMEVAAQARRGPTFSSTRAWLPSPSSPSLVNSYTGASLPRQLNTQHHTLQSLATKVTVPVV